MRRWSSGQKRRDEIPDSASRSASVKDAVRLGYVSDCRSLAEVKYDSLLDLTLTEVRAELGVEESLLRAYYAIEKRRYPNSPESQRLLD